jgi:hypothetical protein
VAPIASCEARYGGVVDYADVEIMASQWLDPDTSGLWPQLDSSKVDELNTADLVIISRSATSGGYDDGDKLGLLSCKKVDFEDYAVKALHNLVQRFLLTGRWLMWYK